MLTIALRAVWFIASKLIAGVGLAETLPETVREDVTALAATAPTATGGAVFTAGFIIGLAGDVLGWIFVGEVIAGDFTLVKSPDLPATVFVGCVATTTTGFSGAEFVGEGEYEATVTSPIALSMVKIIFANIRPFYHTIFFC